MLYHYSREVSGWGMFWKRRDKGNMFWRQMSQFSTPCNTGDMCDPQDPRNGWSPSPPLAPTRPSWSCSSAIMVLPECCARSSGEIDSSRKHVSRDRSPLFCNSRMSHIVTHEWYFLFICSAVSSILHVLASFLFKCVAVYTYTTDMW